VIYLGVALLFIGFAIGIVWQEIHFSGVKRAAVMRIAALERRLASKEGE
jgi:hypothetical protein